MSSPENPVEAAVDTDAGDTALVVPAAPTAPDEFEPTEADLPSLHHAEIAAARRYADASRAASTQRAYASDWRRFSAWCFARQLESLPADPRAVAVFLSAEAQAGSAPLTVGRRLAAIGWMHRRAGFQPPQAREGAAAILEVMAAIRRSHGIAPVRKHAADADVLRDVLRAIAGDDLRSVSDRALLAFGMAGAVVPIRWVLMRDPRNRFSPQALLCTDQACDPVQVLRWFVQRWQVEVTFREVRDHLGVETQRQWSDKAIARTTPCLLGLFSLVTLLGKQLTPRARGAAATTVWYRKQRPTFSDTLAAVRREIWREQGFVTSGRAANTRKLWPSLRNGIAYAPCRAA
ncbi:MAG: hypothetical protein ACRYFY_18855 [Janthinobacterium lividum]